MKVLKYQIYLFVQNDQKYKLFQIFFHCFKFYNNIINVLQLFFLMIQ